MNRQKWGIFLLLTYAEVNYQYMFQILSVSNARKISTQDRAAGILVVRFCMPVSSRVKSPFLYQVALNPNTLAAFFINVKMQGKMQSDIIHISIHISDYISCTRGYVSVASAAVVGRQ